MSTGKHCSSARRRQRNRRRGRSPARGAVVCGRAPHPQSRIVVLPNWPAPGTAVRLVRELKAKTGEIVAEDSTGVVVRSLASPSGAEDPSDRFLIRVKELEIDAERVDLEECNPP